ncbi:hypothetical protein I4U23_006338 [Adineta vaga]|nr:hypothetical protein I4U23_006338 [Adineta vaga]
MNLVFTRDITKSKSRLSNIQILHNRPVPLEEILAVLYPLFGEFYPYDDFIRMINDSHNIFCAYDRIQRRCVACALVNNTRKRGGLYLMLFGVRQSSQQRGLGTHLLKSVINWAYYTGHTYMDLHVHVDNYKAIGLYEKLGFRQSEYLRNYYRNTPKDNPHAYRMILRLQ